MRKKTIVTIVLAMLFVVGFAYVTHQVMAATTDFTANGDVTVSGVTMGSDAVDMLILDTSTAETWTFNSGAFTVTNPGTAFKVGSSDSGVGSLVIKLETVAVACELNSTPGTSYVTAPNLTNVYNIVPAVSTDCSDQCPRTTGAATYNSFPTCGAATCQSGYTLSGSGASGTCTASGGGGGGVPQSSGSGQSQTPAITAYSSGSLLRASNSDKVYLLDNGKKRWIPTGEIFAANGYAWASVKVVDSSVLTQYSEGSNVEISTAIGEGSLIKYTSDNKVYVLESGKKRWIPDAATFGKLGYSWNKIVTVSNSQSYPDGDKKTSNETPVSGQAGVFTKNLSKGMNNNEVKLLQEKLKALGFFAADFEVTGYYGNLTIAAVKKFQSAYGISPVGYVGPNTRNKLNSL